MLNASTVIEYSFRKYIPGISIFARDIISENMKVMHNLLHIDLYFLAQCEAQQKQICSSFSPPVN